MSSNHTEIIARPIQLLPTIIGDTSPAISKESTYQLSPAIAGFAYKWRVTNGGSILGKDDSVSVSVLWGSNTPQKLSLLVFYRNGLCKATDTLNVKPRRYESVNELNKQSNILIYPNPASTELTIELDKFSQEERLQIQTIEGKVLLTTKLKQHQVLSIEEFPKGVLIIKIGSTNYRVVKY